MKSILVPLDGSELAERALGPARRLAAGRGAALLLLQVVPHRPPGEQLVEAAEVERADRYLAGVADRLRAEGATVLVEACAGRAADEVVGQAALWGSDLIVMSTHGRGGLNALVHGSTADAVVRRADRPVLLVPARGGPHPAIAGDTVLVPVDGSPLAEAALGCAAELAREMAVPVTVLHASWYVPSPVEGLAPSSDRLDVLVEEAQAYVDGLVAKLRRAGLEARGEVVLGPAVAAIRQRADELGAAAIVMATHGRGTLGRIALGSVAHEVLTRTAHPLMLVRQPAAAPVAPHRVSVG